MTAPTSLYTCRYWALGSGCPNIANGNNICIFAHWDTGRLASPYDQRGTCKRWLHGNCMNGHSCYYEHRNTGVEGLYQGRVTLHGFNLEVAITAEKSGFNTLNHGALFDLIWAVKRIAMRASKGAVIDRPPPRDPVYPDRFRPSGVGDNTKRKRPAHPYVPPQATAVKLESMIKPQQRKRKFRYRNTKALPRPKQHPTTKPVGYLTQGAQEDPVDVPSDDDDTTKATKKQKIDTASRAILGPSANTSQARVAAESGQVIIADTEILDKMKVDGYTYVRMRQNESLRAVKDALQATSTDMTRCNDLMRTAFDQYSDVLSRSEIHSSLGHLGKNFEAAKTASLEGVGHLNDILRILN